MEISSFQINWAIDHSFAQENKKILYDIEKCVYIRILFIFYIILVLKKTVHFFGLMIVALIQYLAKN